jgi:hypothetical protein
MEEHPERYFFLSRVYWAYYEKYWEYLCSMKRSQLILRIDILMKIPIAFNKTPIE